MYLICKLNDLFTSNMPAGRTGENIDYLLNKTFLLESNHKYGWKTESIYRSPNLIKAIAATWNSQVKNDFIQLVSDPDRLQNIELGSCETQELALAANALDDVHDFCGSWHVLESNDVGRSYEFHTLIHPVTLSQILKNPDDYVLVTGQTVIVA